MEGYGDFNDGFYSDDGDPLDRSVNDDDFDPLELLQSPLFNENRGTNRGSVNVGVGDNNDNYGDFSGQQQARPQSLQVPQMPMNMDGSQASGRSRAPYCDPQNNYGGQAPPPGSSGFISQFGGMAERDTDLQEMTVTPQNMQMQTMQGINGGMPGNMSGGMARNINNGLPGSMNINAAMMNNLAMQGNQMMANSMQGSGGMGMNMNVNAMNAAAMNQIGQLQGMQQALQLQPGNLMQGNLAVNPMMAAGNPMQARNPMMNAAMQAGVGMPGSHLMDVNPNMQGMGTMGGMANMQGGMANMQVGMANMQVGMPNMQGGMNMNTVNRNGSLNTAVSNLNGTLNQMNMSGHQNGMMHGSLSNIQGEQTRGGSLPTSPNPMVSVAQLSASIRAGNSSRSGGRTRGPTPMVDVNGKVIANTSTDPGINEAMEKLCESMRRSAMSRNLVKQLSGRSVQRQGSSRSLSRSNSGVGIRKQMSGRSLSGGLVRGDDGSGRGTPTRTVPIRRLSDAKHRLHQRVAPGNRGAILTNSMGSQASMVSQGQGQMYLQLDDQSLGAL